jgi:hypothetical protein
MVKIIKNEGSISFGSAAAGALILEIEYAIHIP